MRLPRRSRYKRLLDFVMTVFFKPFRESEGMPDNARMKNLFDPSSALKHSEVFETLLQQDGVRIERILSHGQSSPADGSWYDQAEQEWVCVLMGEGQLEFDDGRRVHLKPGDHLLIPAHVKHRVAWTPPDRPTVWLAVFYTAPATAVD